MMPLKDTSKISSMKHNTKNSDSITERSVSFSLHNNEITYDDSTSSTSSWYSQQDYDNMHHENELARTAERFGTANEDMGICSRGLEERSRKQALHAVLKHQHELEIITLYQELSLPSKQAAAKLGLSDYEAVYKTVVTETKDSVYTAATATNIDPQPKQRKSPFFTKTKSSRTKKQRTGVSKRIRRVFGGGRTNSNRSLQADNQSADVASISVKQ